MKVSRVLAMAAAVVGVYAAAIRPRLLRWGATTAEVDQPYPGADLVPESTRGATMSVTIDAPPDRVWPWLVQMGCDRAGWYSWDRLDNAGVPSADRIHPEWQTIRVGDRLAATPDASHWFEVAALEPERFLALRASYDFRGRPFAPTGLRPRAFTDTVWCFLLTPLPGGQTRVVVSGYASARPQLVQAVTGFLLWEPGHWIMQTRQFTNLKRRAERVGTDRGETGGLVQRYRRA